jgi:hypothetical protein
MAGSSHRGLDAEHPSLDLLYNYGVSLPACPGLTLSRARCLLGLGAAAACLSTCQPACLPACPQPILLPTVSAGPCSASDLTSVHARPAP